MRPSGEPATGKEPSKGVLHITVEPHDLEADVPVVGGHASVADEHARMVAEEGRLGNEYLDTFVGQESDPQTPSATTLARMSRKRPRLLKKAAAISGGGHEGIGRGGQ